ncbi:hypothetical protein GCM10009682_29400 [Luedemannella flava]|uniref:HTH cro/C1-type domain-containing protein n=1 Tax=Luedemannella flava TaxID=349316 RepID=A0ABN2M2J7_9ACTN
MGRPEKPVNPDDGPVARFAWQLRQLREQAGSPGYRTLAQRAHYSASTLADAAKGDRLPSLEVTLAFVAACGGDPEEWAARWEATASDAVPAEPRAEARCPYQGLTAFTSEHVEWFFGRTRVVETLLERLGRSPLTALVGPSGSGKSSILGAGLLGTVDADAALRARWRVLVMTPTEHPLDALSDQLAKLSGGQVDRVRAELDADPTALDLTVRNALIAGPAHTRALLVVDQFEEVFTLCADPGERERFVAALVDAVTGPDRRTTVVLGLRADFLSWLVRLPRLADALGPDGYQVVGPVSADDLRDIIVRPAARAGLTVEPELLTRVLADAAAEPGALPLVSHAMLETWRHHSGPTLTLADYEASGGVRGAIAQTAEQLYSALEPADRDTVRRIFLRLTALGVGTEDTRRPIDRVELDGLADEQEISDLLDRLVAARLIVVDDRTVQVAHEALIGAWPRLNRWLVDDRADLVIHRRLTEAAQTWSSLGADPGALYRGAQLSAARAWAEDHQGELNEQEASFLAASRALADAELTAAKQRTSLLKRLLAGMGVLLVVAVIGGVVAVRQSGAARHEQMLSLAGELALQARSLAGDDPRLAQLLAVEAQGLNANEETTGALLSAAAMPRRLQLNVGGPGVSGVALNPDHTLLATSFVGGKIGLWDPDRGIQLATLTAYDSTTYRVLFGRDGRLVTTGENNTADGKKTGSIIVWDPVTHAKIAQFDLPGLTYAVDVSPDGKTVAAGLWNGDVVLIDVATGDRRVLAHHRTWMSSLSFSADGSLLASVARPEDPVVWTVATGRVLATLKGPDAVTVRFGRTGSMLAATADFAGLYLWDFSSGRPVTLPRLTAPGEYAWTNSAPTNGRIAIGDEAGKVTLWDLEKRRPLQVYQDRGRTETRSITLSEDGTMLVSAGFNGTVVVRDLTKDDFTESTAQINDLRISPGGDIIAAAAGDGTVRMWDPHGRPLPSLDGHPDEVAALAFRPDGRLLAAAARNISVTLWDLARRKAATDARFVAGHGATTDVVYSPDGRLMATATLGLWVWDVSDPASPVDLNEHFKDGFATSLAFTPDGRQLVAGAADGMIRTWDVGTGEVTNQTPSGQGALQDIAVSPDGSVIATAGDSRTVALWDRVTHQRLALLDGHTAAVQVLAFSPDGRLLASAGDDHTIAIWDVRRRTHRFTLSGHTGRIRGLAFAADGTLISGGDDGRIVRWSLDPAEAVRRVCANAGAGLSRDEWAAHLPSLDYQPRCDGSGGVR